MKKWIIWILVISFVLTAAGCQQVEGAGRIIYYEGNTAPVNIDPLLAETSTELIAVQHLFEPLLSVGDAGEIQPAAAAAYTSAADGLSYTFTLREDLLWSDGEPVTAEDFVFALQRAVSPETKAACAGQLSGIVGAADVQAGKLPAESLGVYATDNTTLVIALTVPNTGLLTALAGPAGMPCRKEFFENCGGRYGMGKDYVIANGGFAVSRWSTEEDDQYLRLTKNDEYHAADEILPAGITMTFADQTDRLVRVEDGDVDCATLSGSLLNEAADAGFNTLSYYSDSYCLLFNTQKEAPTGNADLRKALVGGVDRQGLQTYLPEFCEKANSIIIPGKFYGTKGYGSPDSGTDALAGQTAKNHFEKAVKTLGADAVKNLELYYVDDDGIRTALDYIVQCWQKEFGVFVTLTAVSESHLETSVSNRMFDIALCPMGNSGKNTLEVLEQFGVAAENFRSGFAGKSFETALQKAKTLGESDLSAQQQCEQLLQSDCIVMPVYCTREYYVYSDKLSGLTMNSFSRVLDFSNTGKFE